MSRLQLGFSRRHFLHSGLGFAVAAFPKLGNVQGAPAGPAEAKQLPPRAKSVILLLLEGGMSHLDTWDPKPAAPREVRGPFVTIQTRNPSLVIGEHMPLLAQQAHLYSVVRSVHSAARCHSPGLHWLLTGYDNPAASINGELQNKVPSVGSIVSHEIGGRTPSGLPPFVAIPNRNQLGGRVNYNGAAFLGAAHEAFDSGAIPAQADAKYVLPTGLILPREVEPLRLADRRRLLSEFDRLQQDREHANRMQRLDGHQHQAFDLLLGKRGQAAFDINQESPTTRQLYGDHEMGQGTLLARRLVEAGVAFVVVNYSRNNSWDTHEKNFERLQKSLLPPADRAASALLIDLEQRGLLDETLVLMVGEMGRTPVINAAAGRDHWPDAYSALIAGGGLARGRVLGSTTAGGEKPATRPVHVDELLATVYRQLGINSGLILHDLQNRPFAILPEAHPVAELS